MNRPQVVLFGCLGLYSALLFGGELATSPEQIRVFFSDVRGPEMWFGFNTTLSVALFWSTATVFAVAYRCVSLGSDGDPRARRFYASQVLFFLYLGADDRFTFHETLGGAIERWLEGIVGFDDAIILGILGLVELYMLVRCMPRHGPWRRAARWLVAAGIFFVISTGIDGFVPREIPGRLSLEDLTKTWAAALLGLWSWELLGHELQRLRGGSAAPPS